MSFYSKEKRTTIDTLDIESLKTKKHPDKDEVMEFHRQLYALYKNQYQDADTSDYEAFNVTPVMIGRHKYYHWTASRLLLNSILKNVEDQE